MSETINWTFTFQVQNGPKMTATQQLTVDTYDKSAKTLAAGAKATLAAGNAGEMAFLLLTSSVYDSAITYKIGADISKAAVHPFDAPLLLVGAGGVGFLEKQPISVQVMNGSGKDVTVEMLTGRFTVHDDQAAGGQGGGQAAGGQGGGGQAASGQGGGGQAAGGQAGGGQVTGGQDAGAKAYEWSLG
jgi:hypothetical protein